MALAFSDRGSELLMTSLASPSTSITTTGGIAAIRYRTGARPAQSATINSAGTLLVTFAIVEADMTVSGNTVTIAAAETASAAAAGDVGHYEAVDSGDNVLFVGTVTATGGGGDIEIENVTLANGQQVNLNTFSVSVDQGT